MVRWPGNLNGICLFARGKLSDGAAVGHRLRWALLGTALKVTALNETLIALGSTVLLEPFSEESLNQQAGG